MPPYHICVSILCAYTVTIHVHDMRIPSENMVEYAHYDATARNFA